MNFFTEERVLRIVVNLSVLNASYSFAHFIETPGPKLTSTQNILPGTSHYGSLAHSR